MAFEERRIGHVFTCPTCVLLILSTTALNTVQPSRRDDRSGDHLWMTGPDLVTSIISVCGWPGMASISCHSPSLFFVPPSNVSIVKDKNAGSAEDYLGREKCPDALQIARHTSPALLASALSDRANSQTELPA